MKNKLTISAILLSFELMINSFAIGQIQIHSQIDAKIRGSVQSLYKFLKTRTTDTTLTDKNFIKTKGSIYDSVTDLFFNTALTDKLFREKEYGDIRFQHQILYAIDKAIDYVPADSIYLIAADFKNGDASQNNKNLYVAGYLIDGKRVPMLDIQANESGRFVFIMPYIYFDQIQGKLINDFILRNKNATKSHH